MTENENKMDYSPVNKGNCLSDSQMARLINNTLNAAEKISCFHHINRCSSCRFCWMETANQIEDTTLAFTPMNWQTIIDKLAKLIHQHTLTISSATVFATMAIFAVLMVPNTNTIESMLNEQYALLTDQPFKIESQRLIKQLSFPWENASMGFSATQTSPKQLAFATGLWDGRKILSSQYDETIPTKLFATQKQVWDTPELNIYYQLGRWMNSLWLASQLNTPADWKQQTVILAQFKQKFQNRKQRDPQATMTLNRLKKLNIPSVEHPQQPDAISAFQHQIELTILLLAPVSLDD